MESEQSTPKPTISLTREEWDQLCHFIRVRQFGNYHQMAQWMKLQNKINSRLDKEKAT